VQSDRRRSTPRLRPR